MRPRAEKMFPVGRKISAPHITGWLLALLFAGIAQADFLSDPLKQGWHWYPPEKTESAETQQEETPAAEASRDPLERIAAIRQELERRKALAVLEPSEQNVLSYITYQRAQVDKASTFSDQFRRLIWTHPEMDYDLQRPTGALAKQVWLDKRNGEKERAVSELGKHYGLFFFFRSDCPYCHRFAPILKAFALRFGLTVIPVSLDGGGLPEYPDPQPNLGQFERLTQGKGIVPAVLAVNPETQKVVPVSYGLTAQDELENRIFVLTQTEVGRDY